jgi:hypothetical protein
VHNAEERTIDDISLHARYVEKKAHACPNCPKSYSSPYRLSDHIKVCSGSISILSNKQDPAFVSEVVAYALETTVLVSARAYKVSAGTVHGWVRAHIDTEPEQCNICGQESRNKEALGKHIRRYHMARPGEAGDGPVLKEHLKDRVAEYAKAHSVEETAEHFSVPIYNVTKWVKMANCSLVCEFCPKVFHSDTELGRHRLTHLSKEEQETTSSLEEGTARVPGNATLGTLKDLYEAKYGSLSKEDLPRSSPVEVIEAQDQGQPALNNNVTTQILSLNENVKQEHLEDITVASPKDQFEVKDEISSDEDDEYFIDDRSDSEFPAMEDSDGSDEAESPIKNEEQSLKVKELNDSSLFLKMEVTSELEIGSNFELPKKEPKEERDKPYSCDYCDFRTARKDNVGNHMKRLHEGVSSGCPACGQQFKMKCDLKKHLKNTHDVVDKILTCKCTPDTNPPSPRKPRWEKFKCKEPDCIKEYSTHSALYFHRKAEHEGIRWYCDQCSLSFKRQGGLASHIENVHDMKRFQCDQCEKGNYSRKGLSEHRRSVHEGINHPCEQCGLTFTTSGNLRTHVRNIHEGQKYMCSLCGVSYNQSTTLAAHMRSTHQGFVIHCSSCEGVFNSKGALKLHFRAKHEGIRYSCDVCDYKATQQSNLSAHKLRKHTPLALERATHSTDY